MNKGFILRASVMGVLAGLASLKASIGGGLTGEEIVDIATATIGGAAAYAGIGATSKTLEPEVGRK